MSSPQIPEMQPVPRINKEDSFAIPSMQLPIVRSTMAIQRQIERNLLFRTWGGIGDQICAEPTLRHALNKFKDCQISLDSDLPELFAHLPFERVYHTKGLERPNFDMYFVFETIVPAEGANLVWQFFSHMLTNCVDFPSLCALRLQLPVADREIVLKPVASDFVLEQVSRIPRPIVVHAGKHWESKTFPKDWWDAVLAQIKLRGKTPVLIGADADDNRGTVDVDSERCLDLRNKLSLTDSIWLCMNAGVLLTNDSSPLHMAAAGDAWIGYIATCKHPDMITHWRKGQWGWRMKNHGLGGFWDLIDYCPNKPQKVDHDRVEESILRSWLPNPVEYADWAIQKQQEFHV